MAWPNYTPTLNYHESYNIFGCSGILFNHESPLRGIEFVTRKITSAFARISLGKQECVELGNLDAKRDWGYAKEYVEGMWKMLQQDSPDTYILATGRTQSIRDFVEMAAKAVNINLEWHGSYSKEYAIEPQTGKIRVRVNPEFYRPAEVDLLIGNPSKAKNILGWAPQTTLEQLCQMMVEADIVRNKK